MPCRCFLLCHTAGVQPGARLMLLGSFSAELAALQASKAAEASLRLPGFEYEAARAAQRRRGAGGAGAAAAAAEAAGLRGHGVVCVSCLFEDEQASGTTVRSSAAMPRRPADSSLKLTRHVR
jgi:hypothetical protein